MNQIVLCLTLWAIITTSAYQQNENNYGSAYHRTDEKRDFYVPPHYAYEYSVHDPHTGDIKSQAEQRQGDVVQGYYTLKEADGTLRQVHYSADKDRGFQAAVKRFGHSYHPHYSQKGYFNYLK